MSSPTHALLKVFRRALAEGKTHDGWVAVEGPRLLAEAMRCGEPGAQRGRTRACALRSVLMSESGLRKFSELVARVPDETEMAQIPDDLFRRISQTETPQGVAALVELPAWTLEACLQPEGAIVMAVCGLQDPGNLGTILRTSDAFGAAAVVTVKGTVSPFNPKAIRASGGALFRLPVFPAVDGGPLMDELRSDGVRTLAADSAAGQALQDADLSGRVALFVGSEAAGVGPEIAGATSARVRIPMQSGVNSLNAAVAASIFLFEAQRQRGFDFAARGRTGRRQPGASSPR